jgi:hypothetical protein
MSKREASGWQMPWQDSKIISNKKYFFILRILKGDFKFKGFWGFGVLDKSYSIHLYLKQISLFLLL